MKYVIVGTAGHIDHGKSALVKSLTGTDPDRWEEEKRRGITIDLGFAHLDLADDLRAGFVDVPGHERFVRNMLAGVGGIDLVLLVIAADESIKPQTREHFDICKLLGLRKGIVVLTKVDLVSNEIVDLVRKEVQEFVVGSFLEGAPIVAVSARTGEGLEALRAELLRVGREVPAKPADALFRLPIDRAFVMKGFGAVVTGTLISGQICREEEVEIFPLGRRARVRGIQVHNQDTERAVAGQRTALNLAGIEARELARGMTLAPPGLFKGSNRLDVALSILPSARTLKDRSRVHFHSWSSEMLAEVVFLGRKELRAGEHAYSQLRLAEPGLFLPGDHFVVRQFSPVVTVGGGVILDNDPPLRHAPEESAREFLHTMETGGLPARLDRLAERAGEISLSTLVARTGGTSADLLDAARQLEAEKRGKLLGQPPSLLVHTGHFGRLQQCLLEYLDKFHAANPLVEGVTKEDLRGRLSRMELGRAILPSALLFNALLQSLAAEGKVRVEGETVRRAGRGIELSAEESEAKEQISGAFMKAELAVPSAAAVLSGLPIDRARAEKILRILLKEKVLVKVTEDLIFHRAALARLRELIARRKQQSNRLNVAIFKELTGLTRKYAIPLLEYLDRERITRREGDERVIL